MGYSTNAYKAFQWLLKDKIKADRVFLLSDMQCWDRYGGSESVAAPFMKWQREVSPNVYLYSIDLAGYGTMQFPEKAKNVVTMAGWSEKGFQFASDARDGQAHHARGNRGKDCQLIYPFLGEVMEKNVFVTDSCPIPKVTVPVLFPSTN